MIIRMALTFIVFCAGIVGVLAGIPTSAKANTGASDWTQTRMADIRLVSAAAGTGDASSVPLGLQFKLAEGWKIYWRTPGDAGFPPDLEIKTGVNLAGLDWQWPVPYRFSLFGQESHGYDGEVVFPITARLSETGKPLEIDAVVHALACSDICVPLDAALSFTLPAGPAGPTVYTQLVSRYRSRVPGPLEGAGLSVTSVEPVGSPKAHSIKVVVSADQRLVTPDVFVEAGTGYTFGKPKIEFTADRLNASLTVPASLPKTGSLDALPVTLTIVDGDRFIETRQTVGASSSTAAGMAAEIPFEVWITMLGFGLLGGFVLNFMPCVLPVLSLKLLGVLRHGGGETGPIRRGFIASALGIMACFLLLAGGAIAMKQAGLAVGWGIQFQQPLFLAGMIVLLAGFAANLFGWLEVPLPAAFARLGVLGPSTGTQDTNAGGAQGLFGHFLTGAFAALLATPCSAPFLGTALGFALARGPVEILAIFGALGIGLALPYLLVAARPSLVRGLPRPGPWMDRLRVILGLALLATAIWLLTVASAQLSIFHIGAITVLLAGAGLILAFTKTSASRLPGLLAGGLAIAILVVVGVADQRDQQEGRGAIETAGLEGPGVNWTGFEVTRLASLVAEGRVVFVDVTAEWCLTCKVNKSLVLDRGEVASRLARGDITAMRADWTKPNSQIAAYLASFQRYGIPFNAVYGP
ncbi:MAG: protein-disulfide reductase DsbD family protein, partial [Alphaproteobacteria bacterium]|nr:protein-disulfide reductase DsbD family protein [Alphaproteobacteria bacterium]